MTLRHRRASDRRRDPGRGHRRPAGPTDATRPCRAGAARERRAVSPHGGSRARHDLDGPAGHDARLPQPHLRGVHGAADGEVAGRGLVGRRPSGRPGPLSSASTSRRSRRARHSSWSTALRRADGAYRWLLATGVPKYGPDGSFAGYVGCDIDITERKDAEDRIRESRAALEASHREIQHLAGRLIEAQDAERARIARDLHDDVSQQLAGLSIALSGLKHRMDELQVGEDLQADLRALHQRTTTLAQNVRHLSHDLHPTVLRHAGLVAALTSYCAELERSHGTALTCSAEGDFASIAPEVALCLYRIAQEALRNVIAHAGASRADVRLLRTGDDAEITIADDGKGSTSRARSSGAKAWGWSASPSGSGSREAPSASWRSRRRERACTSRIPAHALVKPTPAPASRRRREPASRRPCGEHRPPRRRPRDRHGRPGPAARGSRLRRRRRGGRRPRC